MRSPRQQGTLAEWKDDRGFGFIAPAGGGDRVFVHVSDFPRGRRPTAGCDVSYVEMPGERRGKRASEVRYAGAARPGRGAVGGVPLALATAAAFFAVVVGLLLVDGVTVLVPIGYALLSAIAFVMYAADKRAAQAGSWRTSESTLHVIALAGGWPGALVARHVFRHKTRKQPFRSIFWCTVVVNCAVLAWLLPR